MVTRRSPTRSLGSQGRCQQCLHALKSTSGTSTAAALRLSLHLLLFTSPPAVICILTLLEELVLQPSLAVGNVNAHIDCRLVAPLDLCDLLRHHRGNTFKTSYKKTAQNPAV